MVRNFPTSPHHNPNPNPNPLISLTFLVAFVAAVVTIVSSLCGFTKKKHKTTSPPPTRLDQEQTPLHIPNDHEGQDQDQDQKKDNPFLSHNSSIKEPLPPPPAMGKLRASSYQVRSNSNVSQAGKLYSSMSMRNMGGGLKKASKREVTHVKNKLSHDQDSIWKKTIILGEKNKVPDDEEEGVVYDEKGRRIPTFHRKQSAGLQISRQNSTL